MKFAFVFPGQGSQSVGMLNAFAGLPIVRETVAEASEALHQDLGKLMAEGPDEALNSTINTQPVMLTAAYAIYQAWLAAGGPAPSIVAGHSLGEYAGLVAAGALAFDAAVPLVRFRAQAMQEAVPAGTGSMAAIIGLDDATVIALCAEVSAAGKLGTVEAVNFNAPSQVVIAGHQAALEQACEMAKAKGAKRALLLPVSAPFHSSLLQPASDRLREYLSSVDIRAPQIPLINNIDVALESSPSKIKDALVRQVAGPVRWVECMQALARTGVVNVLESGPGKVLTGLTKRIDNTLNAVAISDPETLEQAVKLVHQETATYE